MAGDMLALLTRGLCKRKDGPPTYDVIAPVVVEVFQETIDVQVEVVEGV